jgi:hypothetical protein
MKQKDINEIKELALVQTKIIEMKLELSKLEQRESELLESLYGSEIFIEEKE